MKRIRDRLVIPAVVLVVSACTVLPALAQSPSVSRLPEYGTTTETSYYVGGPAFQGAVPSVWVIHDGLGSAYFTGVSAAYAWAPMNLPQGAAITGFDFYYYDTNAQNISAGIYEVDSAGSMPNQIGTTLPSSGTAGFGSVSLDLSSPWTVNNNTNSYWAWVGTGAPPVTDLKWRGIRVRYKLQVSPAPATATFTDVPVGSTYHRFVEALYASGITAGCGGGNFCPNTPVTRGQMAVFLSAALGLHWPY